MGEKYEYSLEICPVCGAWAVVAINSLADRRLICNNFLANWHSQEEQALEQSWYEVRRRPKAAPSQFREVLAFRYKFRGLPKG